MPTAQSSPIPGQEAEPPMHPRLAEILEELNDRGIYHSKLQSLEDTLDQYEVTATSTTTDSNMDILLMSPITSSGEISADCQSCTPDRKSLRIKSGMSWPHPQLSFWEYREEPDDWSAFTRTFADSTSMIYGEERNVRPYVLVQSSHPVTYADFKVGSEIRILNTHDKYVALNPIQEKNYGSVYFPFVNSVQKGSFDTEDRLPRLTQNLVQIQVSSIR